jgi:hypothetical protein
MHLTAMNLSNFWKFCLSLMFVTGWTMHNCTTLFLLLSK